MGVTLVIAGAASTVTLTVLDVVPAGFCTWNGIVPAVDKVTLAVRLVALTKVVVTGLPLTRMVLCAGVADPLERKPDPVTVISVGVVRAVIVEGATAVMAGACTVKVTELDWALLPWITTIASCCGTVKKDAGMLAVAPVEPATVVGSCVNPALLPTTLTAITDPLTKFVPVAVMGTALLPAGAEFGLTAVTVGASTVKVAELD